jgi:hypothetical protein
MANKKINELSSRTPALSDLMLVGDPSSGYSFKCTVTAIATIIETDIADGYVTIGTTQTISGAKTFSNNLTLTSIANAAVTQTKFLTLNASNVVNYRTGAEVLADIGGQASLSGTGLVKSTSGTISYITDNSSNWNTAYNDSIISAAVSGTTTKTLTLTQQDGGTLTATWSDLNTDAVTSVFGRTGAVVATEGDYSLDLLSDVTLTSPSNGQVLKYNGNAWVNDTDANTGTVTSVAATGGTGISVSGSPITSSGTLTITNTAPDQTVVLNAGTGISVSGTYPNFTITNSSPSSGGTVTSVGLSSATSGVTIGSTPVTTSGTITLAIATASGSGQGLLSSTDWTTFNNKQNAITLTTTGTSGAATLVGSTLNIPQYQSVLTNPVTGTGTTNYIPKFTSAIAIGNSQIFDNGTNVGIGTTNPGAKFHISVGYGLLNNAYSWAVYNTSSNGFAAQFGAAGDVAFATNGNNAIISAAGSNAILFGTNNTERMRITSGGDVGIGTSNPLTKLHLQASSPNYILLTNSAADGVINAIQGGIIGQSRSYANNLAQMASILFRNENSVAWYKGEITFNTNGTDGTDPSISPTERMRITSGGNVGIGTTSPQVKFVVSNGGTQNIEIDPSFIQSFNRTVPAYAALPFYASVFSFNVGNVGIGTTSPGRKLVIVGASQDQLELVNSVTSKSWRPVVDGSDFAIVETGVGVRFTVKAGGNVGIGTTSPSVKLEVDGAIKTAAPIYGTAAAWKLGQAANSPIALNSQYVQIDINGAQYLIPTCYTL